MTGRKRTASRKLLRATASSRPLGQRRPSKGRKARSGKLLRGSELVKAVQLACHGPGLPAFGKKRLIAIPTQVRREQEVGFQNARKHKHLHSGPGQGALKCIADPAGKKSDEPRKTPTRRSARSVNRVKQC